MHRRARHLNPKHAGALMALDARYLRLLGPNNGEAINTWYDRPVGTAYDATQLDELEEGLAPIMQTNIQGGQPVIRFDGTNDRMTHGLAKGNVNSTVLWVAKALSSQVNYKHMVSFTADSSPTYHCWSNAGAGVTNKWSCANSASQTLDSGITATTAFVVGHGIRNGNSHYIGTDGVERASATITSYYAGDTNGRQTIGGRADGNELVHMDIGAVIFIESDLRDTGLLKRLIHSLGFSFKIACS